ncbi:MAG: hypothetical protein LUH15_04585 [Tannerellaceae bacterium]|nr:hypothetical protein [Tannerellaceae bacterium]
MSYDLVVFEREAAPQTKSEFLKWFEAQAEWSEEYDYDDPATATPALQKWFMEMKELFPPMNGEFCPTDQEIDNNEELENHLADYSIGKEMIYASFAWSLCEETYDTTRRLARKHEVGFYDISGAEGDIILPNGKLIE